MGQTGQTVEQLDVAPMGTPDALPGADEGEQLEPQTMGEAAAEDASSPGAEESQAQTEAPMDEEAIREKARQEAAAEFEAQMAELRSIKDKELAQAQKQLQEFVRLEQQRQNLERQQAEELAKTNPRAAYQLLSEQVAKQEADAQRAQAEAGWREWVDRQVEENGLDKSDPEVAMKIEQDLQMLLEAASYGQEAANKAALDWQVTVSQKGREVAVQKAVKDTEARVKAEMEKTIPEVAKAEATKLLAQYGIVPDVGADGQPPPPKPPVDRSQLSAKELKRRGRAALQMEMDEIAQARLSMLSRNQRMAQQQPPQVGLPQS